MLINIFEANILTMTNGMKSEVKNTFAIYWQHIKRHKWWGILIIATIITASTINVIIPLYYKDFFDILTGAEVPGPAVRAALVRILFIIVVFHAGEWILWRVAGLANSIFKPCVNKDLANTCFQYLHKHSFTFFNSNFVGALVKRVNRFLDSFERIADDLIWYLLKLIVNMVVILVVLFSRNIWLGAVVVGWMILFLFVNWLLTNFKYKYDVELTDAETKTTGILADTITNHANVKLFSGYARESRTFDKALEKVRRLRKFTWDLDNIFEGVQAALMIALELGIFYFAIGYWESGQVTVGDFVLIQSYLLNIFGQVWNFGRMVRFTFHNIAEAQEMTQILTTPHEVMDVHNAKKLHVADGGIEFNDVDFHYHSTRKVIHRLNLKVDPKEKLALVGASGSGKSTMMKLLLRQHDVTGGHIFIDGQIISHVTQESLWQSVSLVPQEPILFHRSLLENIRYGHSGATDKEVVAAAKLAHAHEFIQEFPEKYQTFVGERGVKLSGGERQRVAIARAILKNAPILVLDEATSSLDSHSEYLIQDALDKLMRGKTVIVIAHRLSTIMKMDRIVVLDKGKIVEQGTHRELIKKDGGVYAHLWEIQAGGFMTEEKEETHEEE